MEPRLEGIGSMITHMDQNNGELDMDKWRMEQELELARLYLAYLRKLAGINPDELVHVVDDRFEKAVVMVIVYEMRVKQLEDQYKEMLLK